MKLFFSIAIATLVNCAIAQSYEFSIYGGYTFGDRFPVNGGRGKVYESGTYGGSLSFVQNENFSIDLIFTQQDTRGTLRVPFLGINIDEDIAVNYILAGGSKLIPLNKQTQLYSGLKIGTVIISSKRDVFSNITRFAAGFNGGIKFLFTDMIGFKAQANIALPITDVGGYLWWSPSQGTNIGLTSNTPIVQIGFLGGIFIRLQ
ncbi:MAG: hypothetical protein ACK4GL_11660 [Flavobacteriales bacterium]